MWLKILTWTIYYNLKGTDKGLSILANCEAALLIKQPLFILSYTHNAELAMVVGIPTPLVLVGWIPDGFLPPPKTIEVG